MSRMSDHDILRGLVAIPSVTGDEKRAVAWFQNQARQDGFQVEEDGAGNFLAIAGTGPPKIWLAGHIDTVPGDLAVRETDGVLWGRGAVDAKGPLAAFYCAARRHLNQGGGSVAVMGLVDEEGRSRGAREVLRRARPRAIVVGEPSGADGFTLGYKGIVRGRVSFHEEVRHGGRPEPTACDRLALWWADVARRLEFGDGFDRFDGHLLQLESTSDGISSHAAAEFQMRLPPGATDVPKRLQHLWPDAALAIHEHMPAAMSDPRSDLAAVFRSAIRAHVGVPRPKHKTGTADFNHFAAAWPGIPMVAYGPGDSHLDHTPHERLALAEFDQAVHVLSDVLGQMAP